MTTALPRLFSIAPSRPFLPTLVAALLDGRLVPGFRPEGDPLALAGAIILVPTRRAARALRAAFLDALGGRAAILPAIRPLGDIDEDLLLLDGIEPIGRDLSPELDGLERLVGMTRLVTGWSERLARAVVNPATAAPPTLPASPAEAVHLARALLHLLDQMETEGVEWTALKTLVPEEHADWWALTLAFLEIVAEHWPAHLAEKGLSDPARRRNRMIRAEAARLAVHPPEGPVIAAGSTGSIPATADLLAAVARLPNGAVVLPGLDFDLDAASWSAIGAPDGDGPPPVHGHPQYGLKLLLQRLGATREMVEPLDPEPVGPLALALRRKTLSEALKPAETTDGWRHFAARAGGPAAVGEAFAQVTLLEARGEGEAATAIAVALRSVLEEPGRTAALVTPDRALARRVATELGRWGLAVDDSAGVPLSATPPAVLARLAAEVATDGFDPVTLVALMQHPLARFGLPRPEARRAARALEIGALRGPRPRPGLAGLREAFDQARHEAGLGSHVPAARRRLGEAGWAAAEDLLDRLEAALAPLERIATAPARAPFATYLEAHVAAIRAIGKDETDSDAPLFEGEAGEALAALLAGLLNASRDPDHVVSLGGADYPAFFAALAGDQPVRRRAGQDERLFIWGPLEARLQSVDLLVLGGLDEGVWPSAPANDPWLSREMKARLGLEPPERRIGLSAHDFAQGAAAPRVILARALKAGGTPTVASRWLQRLAAVVGKPALEAMRARGAHWLTLARGLDRPPGRPQPAARPAPAPPVEFRPTGLSVTEIETWIRDPYAIYARHVLKLEPLEDLASPPGAGDRGSLVHTVLQRFVATFDPAEPAAAARARFADIVEDELARLDAFPEVVALWRPRLGRIAEWFVGFEQARAGGLDRRILEATGRIELSVGAATFTLRGRADRIDGSSDGRLAILDYKTGTPPSAKQVQCLLAPQLPLEAAMVRAGAFGDDMAGRPIGGLLYVRLSGSGDGGEVCDVGVAPRGAEPVTAEDLAERALEKLTGLVALYQDPKQGYPSRPRIQYSRQTDGPYDHLARVKEWAAGEEGEG